MRSDSNKISQKLNDLSRIIKRKAHDFQRVENESVAGMEGAVLGASITTDTSLLSFLVKWQNFLKVLRWLNLFGGGLLTFLLSYRSFLAKWKGKTYPGLSIPWVSWDGN